MGGTTAADAGTRFVEVNGERTGYRDIGSGAPMLLLTRMRGTIDTWDPLFLDCLARNNRIITADYPGIGYSDGTMPSTIGAAADFAEAFAGALDLGPLIVLGWSWGGTVAQALLLAHPERVTHAVLVGTNPPGRNEIPIQPLFIERAFRPVNDLADEEILFFEPKSEMSRKAAAASRTRIHARPGVTERIPSERNRIEAYLAAAAEFREDAAGRRDALTRTNKPILVVCGDNDISTAGQNWFPLVGLIPNAQLLVYPRSGHGPQHQYPEMTAEHVATFLRHAAA